MENNEYIKVNVMFFGDLRNLTGTRQKEITTKKGVKLSDLLTLLEQEYHFSFKNYIEDNKGIRILINGQEYERLGGINALLGDEFTVVFFPALFGG
ncbi:MoaD/ThiS family protein [Thermovenabulum gondwanense]|uniref:Molybdopterin synthase sulfur carrier subunit n=1 Tax=Thermovenabulum gondwanense TaxID=520767 RepID=A0A162M814_9FIRM|nr:MoaD/ThiS family protein [Thermovenabulum gondwanense]KYO64496.1 hypothetical protein ATZ99_19280 [Thermovenabulum gondwanense]